MDVVRIRIDSDDTFRAIKLVARTTTLDNIKLISVTSIALSSVSAMLIPGTVGLGTNVLRSICMTS